MFLICGCFMMYLCMVREVTQKRAPDTTMVMMPGTHPSTLRDNDGQFCGHWTFLLLTYESDQD